MPKLKGGDVFDATSEWATAKPTSKSEWIMRTRYAYPDNANDAGYAKYLADFYRLHKRAATTYTTPLQCPPGSTVVRTPAELAALPPSTPYCVVGTDGGISQGITKSAEEQQKDIDERAAIPIEAQRRQDLADAKYWAEHPVADFFENKVTGALVKLVDTALPYVPVFGQFLNPVYKAFAPKESKHYKEGSFGEKLGRAATGELSAIASSGVGDALKKVGTDALKKVGTDTLKKVGRLAGFGHTHSYKGGRGILSTVKKGVSKVYGRVRGVLRGPRENYSPSIRALLQNIGSQPIYTIVVRREPLSTLLQTGIDLLSAGGLSRAAQLGGYDHFYHLSLEVLIGPNKTGYIIEKNEVINIGVAKPTTPLTQIQRVDMTNASFNTLRPWLDATQKRMGKAYFLYDAIQNNCQDYILNLLASNNLLTPALQTFVKQDMVSVALTLPSPIQRLMKGITDVAAVANVALHGEGKLHTPGSAFAAQFKRWKVSPETYLKKVREKAKEAGLASQHLGFSSDETHKLQIASPSGKVVRFGAVGLGDYELYSLAKDKGADRHRKSYLARAMAIPGDWAKDPYSPNSLAIKVLW